MVVQKGQMSTPFRSSRLSYEIPKAAVHLLFSKSDTWKATIDKIALVLECSCYGAGRIVQVAVPRYRVALGRHACV